MAINILLSALLTVISLNFAQATGQGFSTAPDPDLSLAPGGVAAKGVPTFQNSPVAQEVMDIELYEFVQALTANARMTNNLRCHVKSTSKKEVRKFSSGSKWVEYLDIQFETDHMGPRKYTYSFPLGSKIGRRITNMDGHGPIEEIKIESGEPYMNWFLFRHDGSRIVWAEVGNIYSFAPCLLRN